ncbi:uncharacterized protein LOC122723070 [Manihot esculenta]|uniref:uncharacterized protein LOC122723070 n=1 Tax=Manihot esculenta TaxID=3983 RepID=UPI001CC62ED0|nr:uncharacterized protein LOC122723070 [Manihot esculenta]
MVVSNNMRNCGEDIPNVKIVEKILRTLAEKFNYIVCSIEESKDIDSLSVDALQSSLLVHEQKFRKNGGEEQALKVSYDEKGSRGHFQYKCSSRDKKANYVEVDEDEKMLLMDFVETNNTKREEMWYLDSECSNRMCGKMQYFLDFDGKQHKEAIVKKSQWHASKKLQLVHADICDPITPSSNSDRRYILTFIDDYSRKLWIYFLNEKSEAFTTFKHYKSPIKKEFGVPIYCLRTDREGEFTSNEFNTFCKDNGISRQLTAAYTPQQNGIAKRKN